MLAELIISNFRLFHNEVTVRFRPITVLIGRNSSGKSSIIKFLLMLQQSIGPGRPQFLTTDGDKVNLGVFSELKNSLTKNRRLSFELTTRSVTTQVDHAVSMHLGLPDHFNGTRLVYKGSASLSYSRKANIGRANYSLVDETSATTLISVASRILDDSEFGNYLSPHEDFALFPETTRERELYELSFESLRRRHKSLVRSRAELQMISSFRYHIDSLRHLLPVRNESQRVIVASPPPADNVGQMGEFALPHLHRITAEDSEKYDFILPHLRRIAGIDSVDFKRSSRYLNQAFARNRNTGADVHIADFGFGVSQCLPIIVQGAIMPRYTSLMVEEPEAQLHPTAQLEMGTYFADLWNNRKVGSVIETHSDNILLRLRRLIAKGELSHQDVSVAFFTFDEENENMPIIKNLNIHEDGSMEAGLPLEFFGANVIEGLRLGAKA